MATMLNAMQMRQAILNVPNLTDIKLKQAKEALSDIINRHGATDLELRLHLAIEDEMTKRGINK